MSMPKKKMLVLQNFRKKSGSSAPARHKKASCLDSRFIKNGHQWSLKDEFLDVIYWGRQILGILLGLVWGFIPLKGFIALFLVYGGGMILMFDSSFERSVEEAQFAGRGELPGEGLSVWF
ncbi:unnamed protein product, partial [Meganyctiphanes norvegica]